jgi:hypothetical protein
MSIFTSTISPFVAAQLKAREKIVGQLGDDGKVIRNSIRDDRFLKYTTTKNSWIKLQSFVEYDSQIFKNGKWISDGRYKGDQLAKKYILEGGTLYNGTSLREGVDRANGIYGSDIDRVSSDPNNSLIDRSYGIRPMPGIIAANVMNISAYGSLREATVRFYAWDRHQLEELEVLFMRPGYTCLLEWGWSTYLDHDDFGSNGINTYPNNINIRNDFFRQTIDVFTPGFDYNEESIYSTIDKNISKYKGNYDAMLGFVKNFSWQLMPNGGFECSTTLISRGEVLQTIKASSNPNIIVGSSDQLINTVTAASQLNQPESPVISYFEKIFLNLIGYINTSEITEKTGQLNPTAGQVDQQGQPIIATAEQIQSIKDKNREVGQSVIENVKGTKLKRFEKGKIENITGFDIVKEGFVLKLCDGGINGSAIEYMSFDTFIAILNTFFVLKVEETEAPIVSIVLPNDTPFLVSEDTVSVDPTTCLIYNPNATFVTGETNGFKPELLIEFAADASGTYKATYADIPIITNDSGKKNIGSIGKIYISLQRVIDIYRGIYSSDGVSILELLKKLLDDINLALGGLNNFQLYTTKNIVQIIDAHYLEDKTNDNGGKDNKFTLDLIGLKSVCRDVKINSRIFSEQSSMIGIGAAASGTNNIGDIYSSTQTAFNKGLRDKVVNRVRYGVDKFGEKTEKVIVNGKEVSFTTDSNYYYTIAENVLSLRNHLKFKVLGTTDIRPTFKVTRIPQSSDIVNASSLLKTAHFQINGEDVDYKALIPFELEITLDGISGFITGQIFRIEKNILPREYHNKNFGFIITKLSHSLQNNDWVTTVTTQVCLLDNDDFPFTGVPKAALKSSIEAILKEAQQASYLQLAITDLIVSLVRKVAEVGYYTQLKQITDDNKKAKYKQAAISKAVYDEAVKTALEDVDEKYVTNFIEDWIKNYQTPANMIWERSLEPVPPSDGSFFGNIREKFSKFVNNIVDYIPVIYSPNFKTVALYSGADGRIPNFPEKIEDFLVSIGDQKIKFDYKYLANTIFNKRLFNSFYNESEAQNQQKPISQQNFDIDKLFNTINDGIGSIFYGYNFFSSNNLGGVVAVTDDQLKTIEEELKKVKEIDSRTVPTDQKARNEFYKNKRNEQLQIVKDNSILIPPLVTGKWLGDCTGTMAYDGNTVTYVDPYKLWAKVYNWVVSYIQKTNPRYNIPISPIFSRYWDSKNPGNIAATEEGKKYLERYWSLTVEKDPKAQTSSTTTTYNPNNPAVGGFPSDINVKENIEFIGKSEKGINIYKFKYKNQEGYYQGVMAQELIGTEFEQAIIYNKDHYLVDYSLIDVEFKKIN